MAKLLIYFFVLELIQIYTCKRWEGVGKTLTIMRNTPEPGERRKVFTINSMDEMLKGPRQEEAKVDPATKAFEEASKRIRRSTPGQPKHSYVRNDSAIF